MKAVFYITNHGFGHAARNVPIILELLKIDQSSEIIIKSDLVRCEFLRRNLGYQNHIRYYMDCNEYGLVMQEGCAYPDISHMYELLIKDIADWGKYIKREISFLENEKPDLVVADIIGWAIKAARRCDIPTVLIGNFTWESMYRSFYKEEIWKPYHDCYALADLAIWYDIHSEELHDCNKNYKFVSLISRDCNSKRVEQIRRTYKQPLVFVSIGGSVEIKNKILVQNLPYTFLVTQGLHLVGDNVIELPKKMINTPDYISASEYVIAKGGWSTVSEILLQKKKSALLFRGNNSEDNKTRNVLSSRGQCVPFEEQEIYDIETLLKKIDNLKPQSFDVYKDDRKKICGLLIETAKRHN